MWEHPTIKPQHMIEKLIRNSSKQGQLVMDLYLGSGTTAAACKKLNRNFIGSEINEKYYNIALKRVEETVQETEDEQSPLSEFFE
jgi:site-specific DNA-methyltransferase (adenine-specific)